LKPSPTRISPIPNANVGIGNTVPESPLSAVLTAARFVVPRAPYTNAIPYTRKPVANAPRMKYLNEASPE